MSSQIRTKQHLLMTFLQILALPNSYYRSQEKMRPGDPFKDPGALLDLCNTFSDVVATQMLIKDLEIASLING